MFSMCVVLLVFSSISTVVVVSSKTVTGHRGERVDIRCSYESGYESNSKYFCKGKCNYRNKIIMVKSGSPAKDKRFSLTDNKRTRVFTVSITDLRTEDTGLYWCAVERTLTDVYSEVLLIVKQMKKTTTFSTINTFTNTPSYFSTTEPNPRSSSIIITERKETITDQHKSAESETTRTGSTAVQLDQLNTNLSSVAGGLGSVLLVLVLCSGTFLILKKRKRKSGTALFQQNVQYNTESVHMYEIAISDTGPSDVIAATSSSNQTPASHLNTRPQVSAVYATVTNQQPDSNPSRIHSANQVTDTDCDYYANMKSPEPTTDCRTELIYATATHPQNVKTNDGPIYSMIKHK
ncbi:CMRF35-like molecule 1 [Sinocyclocheilus rhinocerous]|uniref:CMRF35-like molecule 1 n=1 Tax=Sinocyclocheilus rhinocerous TaxID=307959 RepID=UPI0007B97B6B|nr:PREDICTED: CMRF35-like molecule 1 [Sinocyclocheilus rhinocerous]